MNINDDSLRYDDEEDFESTVTAHRNFTIVPNGLIGAGLSSRAFQTYVALRSYLRPDNATFPYLRSVAEKYDLSESFLRRGIKELTDGGFLVVTKRRSKSGMRQSNLYHFPDVPDQPVKSDRSVKSPQPVKSDRSNLTDINRSNLTDINRSNLTALKEEEKREEEKKEEEKSLPSEPLPVSEPPREPKAKPVPVTGKRLIHPKTGEPATDAERLEIFNSFSDKLASMMVSNGARRPNPSKAWTDAIRLLLESDGIHPRDAWEVLVWSQHDGFWHRNIHSLPKFREKYDKLLMDMRKEKSGGSRKKSNAEQGHDLVAKYEAMEQQQAAMSANWALGNGAVVPEIEYSAGEVYEG